MTEPRELSEQESKLLGQLLESGAFDAVLVARVQGELKYFPPTLADEYITASAWLVLARARQTAALRKIQKHAKGLSPDVAGGLLVLWAAQAAELAESKVREAAPPKAAVEQG